MTIPKSFTVFSLFTVHCVGLTVVILFSTFSCHLVKSSHAIKKRKASEAVEKTDPKFSAFVSTICACLKIGILLSITST